MTNNKYNISENGIISVSPSTSGELIQLSEQVTLNSSYRQVSCGSKIPSNYRPVTARSASTHDQAKSAPEASLQPTNTTGVLRVPSQVASTTHKKD